MIEIEVNNGQVLEIAQRNNNGEINVIKTDNQGYNVEAFSISAGDFVTMLNWYRYQKETGNTNLEF